MAIKTADDLFLNELKDIYSAEKQAVRAYPKVAKKITSGELRSAVDEHLEQTKGQVERLDRVFEILEKRSGGKTCEAMKGLVEEGQEALEEIEQGPLLDAALIGSLQRMEHYEIASYGTAIAFAEALGQNEIQELLQQTLEEEKQTDEKLTEVARQVNQEAIGGGDDDEEDEEEDDSEEGEDEDSSEDEDEDDEDDEASSSAKKSSAKKSAAKKTASKGPKR